MTIDNLLELSRKAKRMERALEHHKTRLRDSGVIFDAVALFDLESAVNDVLGAIDEQA